MRRFGNWAPWDWDIFTAVWTVWMVFFFVWEAVSRHFGGHEMLTDHLRPIFLSYPVVWFIAFGIWLWLGVHLLAPTLEAWISSSTSGVI